MEGSQVTYFCKNIVFLTLKIDFTYTNSAVPDEVPHSGSSHSQNIVYLWISSTPIVKVKMTFHTAPGPKIFNV